MKANKRYLVYVFTIVFCLGCAERKRQPGILFENVSEEAGLLGATGIRGAFADFNGDGYPDIIMGGRRIYLNRGGKTFVEIPGCLPVEPGGEVLQDNMQAGDVNNDGNLDLFLGKYVNKRRRVNNRNQDTNQIWIGDGKGAFRKVSPSGLEPGGLTAIAACFVDLDCDGNLDLVIANAYDETGAALEAYADQVYRGKGDGRFVEVTSESGLSGVPQVGLPDSRRPSYGVTHTDWNNDGWQDLLIMSYGRQANRLWKNRGDGTFEDVAPLTGFDGDDDRSGVYSDQVKEMFRERYGVTRVDEKPFRSHGNTIDCAVADFDNDGDMDCFLAEITHAWAGSSSDKSMLLINQGCERDFVFHRSPESISRECTGKNWNQGDLHAGWIDVDNDGRLDLLVASSDYPNQILRLYHQKDSGDFEEWTECLGPHLVNASQISLGDFDRDGATDILVASSDNRLPKEQKEGFDLSVRLLRNIGSTHFQQSFFQLRLTGQSIGARVIIDQGSMRQMREVHGGLGHSGHLDDLDCRFGVGKWRKLDRVEVRWPDGAGTVQVFKDVPTNRFYTLSEGGVLKTVD